MRRLAGGRRRGGIPGWSQTLKGTIGPLYYEENERALALAREKRRQFRAFLVNDVRDAEAKARLLAEAEAAVARVKRGCDLLVGTQLVEGLTDAERETWQAELLIEHTAKETLDQREGPTRPGCGPQAQRLPLVPGVPGGLRRRRRPTAADRFRRLRRQPAVYARPADPRDLGRTIASSTGLYPGSSGNADQCAFFFLRAFTHLRPGARWG